MGKTLLLADDSVTIQKVVGISFASEDVTLITVDNGDDAVAKAQECRPDAILADVVMPGRSGYEVCEAIKNDPSLRHIPVLLLTGTFEAFDEERALRCGAAGHVAKPFEAQTLVERVKELLAQAPPPAEAAPTPSDAATPPVPELAGAAAAEAPASAAPRSTPSPSDSFDFFDDDFGDLSSSAGVASAPPSRPAAIPDPETTTDSPADATVALDEAAPAAPGRVAPSAPRLDHTVAILTDEPEADRAAPPAATQLDRGLDLPGGEDLMSDEAGAADSSPVFEEEAFDFDVAADSRVPERTPIGSVQLDQAQAIEDDALGSATVLDPKGSSSFDISSSDLGDPLAQGPGEPGRSPLAKPMAAGPPARDAQPEPAPPPVRAPEPASPVGPPPSPPALETSLEPDPFLRAAHPPQAPEPSPAEPIFAMGPDDSADPLSHALMDESALEDLAAPMEASSEGARAGTHDPAALAGVALAEITPRLRQELHDTLEKITWESFGDVTEQIVQQALERVERVAWEVIPQLAETLIREEIRRMKGGDD